MKLIYILALLLPFVLSAEHLFREVNASSETWQVQFQAEGIKYRIKVDGDFRGISDYLQILSLKKTEELKLTDKHQSILARWSEEKNGIELTVAHRAPNTGEMKISKIFEPIHKSNQPNQSQ
ncbi:Unannotated [Lentimonas sp. CC4]|nr:Unannotated [Lentimonas sp. CC4]CAA6686120.1 Unannotated [Lentimonas sp. CC6]CAA7074152.1 Unannotated [Lentimonas sp. CC4]CAA7171510.1 Unannotated [Lentimonas sp. CC21]CAA7181988.1 Unannotated [Lentimonas sp. CC8]